MRRTPRDEESAPFDAMFRMVERMMEETTENMNRMLDETAANMDRLLGPYGSVDFDANQTIVTSGRERPQNITETPVDVREEDDEIRVAAELPGVSKDAITVRCNGRTLSIRATGDRHEYSEQVRLPAQVDERAATAAYNNGILEVTLPRHDTGSNDATIDVDETAQEAEEMTDETADVAEQQEASAEATGEQLEDLEGIGSTYADRLRAQGIESVTDLAEATTEAIADAAEVSEERAEEWIEAAQSRA